MAKLFSYIFQFSFTLSVFAVQVKTQSATLSNATVQLNGEDSANFTCTGPSNDQVAWSVMTPQAEKIYVSTNGYFDKVDKNKFIVTSLGDGGYTLTVVDPDFEDAVTYECDRTSANQMFANLVVIATPKVEIIPVTSGSNNDNGYNAGDQINITCTVQYGAPPTVSTYIAPLSSEQQPTLQIYKDAQEITKESNVNIIQNEIIGKPSSLAWNMTYTLTENDAGSLVKCVVLTKTPDYSDSASTPINLIGSTQKLNFSITNNTDSYIGSNITCHADGFPPPMVTLIPLWSDVSTEQRASVRNGKGEATVTVLQKGKQLWQCVVDQQGTMSQSGSSMSNNSSMTASIQFYGVPENGTLDEPQSNNAAVALGVGLGIGLGVPVLIAIIVLIVVLARRRGHANYKPANTKPKKSNAKNTSGKQQPSNDTNRPKQPQPPNNAPKPTVNQNPNPYSPPMTALNTARAPVGRDSPGFGDIGATQMNGTGTPVNESFDSSTNRSFDQDRRRAGETAPKKSNVTRNQNGRPNTDV